MRIGLNHFIPAVIWFIIICILLTLPASRIPDTDFFQFPHRDKIIHIFLFFILVSLFCRPFKILHSAGSKKAWFLAIAFLSLAYGIAMEFVQENFVANRSYEILDIVADGVGCLFGYLYSTIFFMSLVKGKKIGPDGNRGRNQN